jgi:hypothetical protein
VHKLLLLNVSVACLLVGCNAGSTSTSANPPSCPASAPLFSATVGTELINNWGVNAFAYSPYGSAGYTDPYVGAAYFTGVQYLSNAVLLPTLSPVTRDGSQAIYDYFTGFLAKGPVMTNNPGTPESGGPFITLAECGYGVISGYYNFTFTNPSSTASARYTFEFQYISTPEQVSIMVESGASVGQLITVTQPAGWYIALQNSAALPSE